MSSVNTIWLVLRAGKEKQIVCSDWLPADGSILPARTSDITT